MTNIGQTPVFILETQQCLDSSNYQAFIEQAKEAYEAGNKRIVIDFQQTNSISTFGLYALHSIVSLFYNEPPPTLELWTDSTLRVIRPTKAHALNKLLLIRNPKPQIAQALFSIGFYDYAEIFVSA